MKEDRSQAPLRWTAAMAEHIGGRRDQQDRVRVFTDETRGEYLLVVSDGVGGHAGGALASQTVVETAAKMWAGREGQTIPRDFLDRLCRQSHAEIVRVGEEEGSGPRATIAAVYLSDGHAGWVHSGDSRVYRFQNRRFVERTRDHSVLQILVDKGAVSESQMGNHPDQGKLLQSLGGDEFREPSFGEMNVEMTDAFLVCSDGFWEHIPPNEAAELLTPSHRLAKALQRSVALAAHRGGPKADNVSVAALVSRDQPHCPGTASLWKGILIGVATTIILVAALAWHWRSAHPRSESRPEPSEDFSSKPATPTLDQPATGASPRGAAEAGPTIIKDAPSDPVAATPVTPTPLPQPALPTPNPPPTTEINPSPVKPGGKLRTAAPSPKKTEPQAVPDGLEGPKEVGPPIQMKSREPVNAAPGRGL